MPMPSDPIRAALSAALGDLSERMQRDVGRRIAAFLRALYELADGGPIELPCSMIYTGAFHELADEVEAAARETPHDE